METFKKKVKTFLTHLDSRSTYVTESVASETDLKIPSKYDIETATHGRDSDQVEKKKKKKESKKKEILSSIKNLITKDNEDHYFRIFQKELYYGEDILLHENNVSYSHKGVWVDGIFVATNYRIMFFYKSVKFGSNERKDESDRVKLTVIMSAPVCAMYKIEKVGGRTTQKTSKKIHGYQIVIYMKNLRTIKISLNPENKTRGKIAQLLRSEMPPEESFAYSFRLRKDKQVRQRKLIYDIEKEFGLRQKVVVLPQKKLDVLYQKYPDLRSTKSGSAFQNWRITRINEDYSFADTYPSLFCVPVDASDDDLFNCAQSRSRKRIPILCWAERNTGLSITRSAQPKVGLNITRNDFKDDQKIIQSIINSTTFKTPLAIIDVRPKINAEANRFRGGGYERGYKNCEIHYMGVHNIHVVRTSFQKMMEVCSSSKGGADPQFHVRLSNTGWLEHVRSILKASLFCCKCIEKDRKSILIHCSDGWDRTSQCVCLTELMLDPYYRTLEGFVLLIEKEWLECGHQFQKRLGTGFRNFFSEERSPIFFQFLESTRVMMEQHPSSFQFNEEFLIFLMDEIYAARFGNFLFDSTYKREENNIDSETEDIWNYVFDKKIMQRFLNPFYDPLNTKRTIIPDLRRSSIVLWENYWLRFHFPKEISKITLEPDSSFHYHNTFPNPRKVMQKRCMEMMKEISQLTEHNHLVDSKNEKHMEDMDREIKKMGRELCGKSRKTFGKKK